jgi:3-deoxy-D-manno-octulosonic-acid transferase
VIVLASHLVYHIRGLPAKGTAETAGEVPRPSRDACVWLHAVSVGEVNLLARCWEADRP